MRASKSGTGKLGRPTKLTPELQRQIVSAVRDGNFLETAARAAAVPDSTLYRWLQDGERGRQPYRDFRDVVERAKGEAEVALVSTVRTAAENGSWRAAVRLLESLAPRRWRGTTHSADIEMRVDPSAVVESPAARIMAQVDRIAARLREETDQNAVSQLGTDEPTREVFIRVTAVVPDQRQVLVTASSNGIVALRYRRHR